MDISHWPQTESELERAQLEVARRADEIEPWQPPAAQPMAVAGCFIAYPSGRSGVGAAGDPAWLAAVAIRDGVVIASATVTGLVGAPYRPGWLALREGPLLEKVVRELVPQPDIIVVNATGRDHPRRAGLALHLGAVLDLPTVGVTDRALIATGSQPEAARGAMAPLLIGEEVVGYRLRTRAGVRPLCVHAGWRTLPRTVCDIIMAVSSRSRTPEPLREARRLARSFRSLSLPPRGFHLVDVSS